jgi:hypothetical protein
MTAANADANPAAPAPARVAQAEAQLPAYSPAGLILAGWLWLGWHYFAR